MNNYVLNNTSVYLGGQCRWDIILDACGDGKLEIKGFQLAPLSSNVPFNKKPNTNLVNTNHSENFKKYYNSIKKNFWSIKPDNYNINGYDRSCIRGLKRLPQYKLYNKQFGYLLPIWLERLGEDDHLEFEFVAKTGGSNPINVDLGVLKLESNENFGYFHNKFCEYIENWFKYTNIIPKTDSILDGNNKVLNVNLPSSKAQIYGVNVTTGQISNDLSVDSVVENILLQERPLMETDYILSTLFKNHNIVISQLFNLNFCFNFEDIISSAILNMMTGGNIGIDCNVYICNDNGKEQLKNMHLYTNYEYIPRELSDPYLVLTNCKTDEADRKTPIVVEDIPYDDSYTDDNKNILSYLKDYSDPRLIKLNKLSQPIVHWGYLDDSDKTFNVYEGFDSAYVNIIKKDGQLKKSVSYVPSSNGISVLNFPTIYKGDMNEMTWLYPGRIMDLYDYLPSGATSAADWIKIIRTDVPFFCNNYGLSLKNSAEYWGVKYDEDSSQNNTQLLVIRNNLSNSYSSKDAFNSVLSSVLNIDEGNQFLRCGYYANLLVIYTNNNEYILLQNLIDNLSNAGSDKAEQALKFLNSIKNIVTSGNEGNYIGFSKELGVGEDELGNQTYFKMKNKSVFPNRKSDKLRPLMTDSDVYINYTYKYNTSTGDIERFEDDFDPSEADGWYEYLWSNNDNSYIVLLNKIEVEYDYAMEGKSDNPDTEQTVMEKVKNGIKNIYKLTDDGIVDYIYGLYDKDYFYEYDNDKGKCVLNLI